MKIIAPIAIAAATAATFGLQATPAQAATNYGGCTVTPHVVRFYDYTASGYKRVLLRVDIKCQVERWVNISQQGWEDDNKPSDHKDDHWYSKAQWVHVAAGTSRRIDTVTRMPDTPNDGAEELYQRSQFRVQTVEQYPVTSAWTAWEATANRTIAN